MGKVELKGETRTSPVHIDERGLTVGEQVYYNLSKSNFIVLTKVWSRLIFWAQFTLAIVVTNLINLSARSLSAHSLVIEYWQYWFIGIAVLVTLVLFILGCIFNPKRKIIKRIEKFFEEYE